MNKVTMTLMELRGSTVAYPEGLTRRILSCATRHWLVPRGERPFAMGSFYGGKVFSPNFRKAFEKTYARSLSLAHFDVWSCAAAGGQISMDE